MGVDRYHGVSDVSTLRAVSEINLKKGFLGAQPLLNNDSEVIKYREALEYAFEQMQMSIVGGCVLDAIEGNFGNHHRFLYFFFFVTKITLLQRKTNKKNTKVIHERRTQGQNCL